jgi:hypothetical protein
MSCVLCMRSTGRLSRCTQIAARAVCIALAISCATPVATAQSRWSVRVPSSSWVFRVSESVAPDQAMMLMLLLQLDDEQRAAATALYEGYLEQFLQAYKTNARYQSALNRTSGPNEFRRDEEASKRYQQYIGALRERFFADVRDILTPAQLDHWPRVERHIERVALLTKTGNSADQGDPLVIAALALEGRTPGPDAMTAIDRYLADSHRLLVRIDAERSQAYARLNETAAHKNPQNRDRAAEKAEFVEARKLELEHKQLALDMIDRLSALLPEAARAQFVRAAYPGLLLEGAQFTIMGGQSEADMINWVFAQPDVTPDQRAAIEDAVLVHSDAYADAMHAIVQTSIDTGLRELESGQDAQQQQWPPRFTQGEEMLALRDRFAAAIRAHLTVEQIARAPRPLNNTLPPVPTFADLPEPEVKVPPLVPSPAP